MPDPTVTFWLALGAVVALALLACKRGLV